MGTGSLFCVARRPVHGFKELVPELFNLAPLDTRSPSQASRREPDHQLILVCHLHRDVHQHARCIPRTWRDRGKDRHLKSVSSEVFKEIGRWLDSMVSQVMNESLGIEPCPVCKVLGSDVGWDTGTTHTAPTQPEGDVRYKVGRL